MDTLNNMCGRGRAKCQKSFFLATLSISSLLFSVEGVTSRLVHANEMLGESVMADGELAPYHNVRGKKAGSNHHY